MLMKAKRRFPGLSNNFVTACAAGASCVFKQHIMLALMHCGYTNRLYGNVYSALFFLCPYLPFKWYNHMMNLLKLILF